MLQAAVHSHEAFIAVPGGKVFVRTWTSADSAPAPPVVLLHDSLGCVDLWRDFPEALAQRLHRPVIAYDRLGYGRSSGRQEGPALNFMQEEAARQFPAVREALGIEEYALFGHSVGGGMSLMIAGQPRERCRAVISESAQALIEERTREGILRAKQAFQEPRQFDRLTKWHGDKAGWVLAAWTETWLLPQFRAWSLERELPLVQCPVLAIHGDQDEFGSTASPRLICEGVGGRRELAILPGCGHVPHRERPDEVLDRVAQFLGVAEETVVHTGQSQSPQQRESE